MVVLPPIVASVDAITLLAVTNPNASTLPSISNAPAGYQTSLFWLSLNIGESFPPPEVSINGIGYDLAGTDPDPVGKIV